MSTTTVQKKVNDNTINNFNEIEKSMSEFIDLFLLKVTQVLTNFCPSALTISDEEGLYPLHIACLKGNINIVKYLFENYSVATTLQDSKYNLYPLNILLKRFNTENENFIINGLNLKSSFSIVKTSNTGETIKFVDINRINKKRSNESFKPIEVENSKIISSNKKSKLSGINNTTNSVVANNKTLESKTYKTSNKISRKMVFLNSNGKNNNDGTENVNEKDYCEKDDDDAVASLLSLRCYN
jgi:hypothetical protein